MARNIFVFEKQVRVQSQILAHLQFNLLTNASKWFIST